MRDYRIYAVDFDGTLCFSSWPELGKANTNLINNLIKAKETAWLVKKYSKLDETWPQMLHDGFAECMRVLKPDGVLIFKWNEFDIPADKVWKAIGQKPLFGHHSGKKSKTFWACFMKLDGE